MNLFGVDLWEERDEQTCYTSLGAFKCFTNFYYAQELLDKI
jgi:hypothetical protein